MAVELLKLDLEGIDAMIGSQDDMRRRLEDETPVFEWADLPFRLEMAEQFATQGAYLENGQLWTPLSPEYAARKPAPPEPYGILYRSGALFESLSQDGGDHVRTATATQGTYGTTVDYGQYHQTGTEKMPQRRIIRIRDKFRELVMYAVQKWILTGEPPQANSG